MWIELIQQAASPEIAASVNPPADAEAIAALESRLGVSLPEAFKAYLATMDGQNALGDLHGFVGDDRLLPIAEIIALMDQMSDLFGDEEPLAHIKENKVRPVLWDPLWVPFGAFDGAPRLILDLHPGSNGTVGQVVQTWPGADLESDDLVIAASFADFSADLLRDLKAG